MFRIEADQANHMHVSFQLQLDLQSGLDQSQAFENAQPEIERIVARLARYKDQYPEDVGYRIDAAQRSSFLTHPPLESLLDLTNIVDEDPEQIPKRKEFWIATRALALLRNDRHDDAVELFKKYPGDPKDMQSLLVKSLAHVPSEPDVALAIFKEAEKKWVHRKHFFFDCEMLLAEVKNALRNHLLMTEAQ